VPLKIQRVHVKVIVAGLWFFQMVAIIHHCLWELFLGGLVARTPFIQECL